MCKHAPPPCPRPGTPRANPLRFKVGSARATFRATDYQHLTNHCVLTPPLANLGLTHGPSRPPHPRKRPFTRMKPSIGPSPPQDRPSLRMKPKCGKLQTEMDRSHPTTDTLAGTLPGRRTSPLSTKAARPARRSRGKQRIHSDYSTRAKNDLVSITLVLI